MTTIIDPTATFEDAKELIAKIETNWESVKLPHKLVSAFICAWEKYTGHPALRATGMTRLHTSSDRSENIADVDLSLGIAVSPLRALLHGYKKTAKDIAARSSVDAFLVEYKSKVQGTPACWPELESAIDSSSDVTAEEKALLKSFLTDSEKFYDIKGITRDDFATPALCRASGKRVDRFSIIDQIAAAAHLDPDIYSMLLEFINNVDSKAVAPASELKLDDLIPSNFTSSLLAKPFTIITGASGTGKTRLAKDIAKYLSNTEGTNSATVAVGADWTDNRSVLGFVNYLRTVKQDQVEYPVYQSTPILDLMLAASEDTTTPYFLILDEMNLSHVERYFADFLSVMEQDPGVLELHKEGDRKLPRHEGDLKGVPPQISYPSNLFVIGTVNIDETTYMFSPKVLDRANVIEFTVETGAIESFLKAPTTYPEIEVAAPGIAAGFLTLAKQARNLEIAKLPQASTDSIANHLLNLFAILKDGRFEFAFRTAKEVNAYLRVCRHLSADQGTWDSEGWKQDLDDQILQKLLPKLHGSMGRIGGLLAELADYCHTGTYTERTENSAGIQLKTAANLVATDSTPFPKSLAKLKAMIRTLQDEQFVSFIQ
ncbi:MULTISPECIES: McrB family protein [unclassified Lentimonas]|uniref:McrB family protein n=1 Tax=unclassified Lentimonas TaxID=2630993 RepID=UPI001320B4D1|nr:MULTISPECIES: hypothetical protein [unclassified Lentimonas]CAA6692628.1 5-methylcytosine-specific restriction related enzyme [Lentimonas sp. CC19]CAA6696976.1 5-methylcytosine-specific restriction related enzyme [Lentimonas sp. CC10]CAA7071000.1 5-methylcytosine-specific restriction related enzyme [Lentimonas sp. CC11]